MGSDVEHLVKSYKVFPDDESIQSVDCPICHNTTPTGYTRLTHDVLNEKNVAMVVTCVHCEGEFFIQPIKQK